MALASVLLSLTVLFCLCVFFANTTTNKEFLHMGQSLGMSDTLVSSNGNFELGFFPGNNGISTTYYLGIWFKMVPNDKIVWVANRDHPIMERFSAVLRIQPDGNIVINDGSLPYRLNDEKTNYSTYAKLLDNGNFVLVNSSNEVKLWQSFDYPTDTLLLGMNLIAEEGAELRSWKSANDPTPGPFSFISYDYLNTRVVLEVSGELKTQYWSDDSKRWVTVKSDKCGFDNECGAFTICNPEAIDRCHCLKGFKPFDADSWRQGNRSAGCVRKTELACSNTKQKDVFLGLLTLRTDDLPANGVTLETDSDRGCETNCYSNCSCVAYAFDFNRTCYLWHEQDSLLNLTDYSADVRSSDYKARFYLRLAASESVSNSTKKELLHTGESLGISDTIVSLSGNFELGFFSININDTTKHYYLGIWFKMVPNDKIVWVANRDRPLTTSSAILRIDPQAGAVIEINKYGGWWLWWPSTNVENYNVSTYAMLLDSGNFVLLNSSNQAILWQSFDDATDTLLPGMSITDGKPQLTSWTSPNDPTSGPFSLRFQYGGGDYWNLINLKDSQPYWVNYKIKLDIDSVNNTWNGDSKTSYSRMVLEVSGELKNEYWSEDSKRWVTFLSFKCGAFTISNPEPNDTCDCLIGFKPYDANSWSQGDRSDGCVRKTELACSNTTGNNSNTKQKDEFLGLLTLRTDDLPANGVTLLETDSDRGCETNCYSNCSCVAYAFDFNKTCYLWHEHDRESVLNLVNYSADVQSSDYKARFYLRLAASEFSNNTNGFLEHGNKRTRYLLLIILLIPFLTLLVLGLIVFWTRRQSRKGEDLLHFEVGKSMKFKDVEFTEAEMGTKVKKKEVKLPLFSFASVSAATDNYSDENKLGEGGFGPVYKGKLLNGEEVAVKRLSRRSGQGWEELRNEALLIAKLQHNNLVRLLGCCIDRNEKMLIYEYMPNKSLDFFLFDVTKRRMLDWGMRVRIIDGIAQGLLYLHQYSRFRIIHRDLKASNILLDINMNPKISDFGLARIFGDNEFQANTNRIVGTYGYMSPEYAMEGIFSIKSDVFSFGVLLLEIVSGKKNTGFYQTNSFNLLGYAWDLWTSNAGRNLKDPELEETSDIQAVSRYVNIGLLCVQESPTDRPTMSDVVTMISNDVTALPCPKPPAFLNVRGNNANSNLAESMPVDFSVNVITGSIVEAR